jgi:hypothetical protein
MGRIAKKKNSIEEKWQECLQIKMELQQMDDDLKTLREDARDIKSRQAQIGKDKVKKQEELFKKLS